MPVKGTVVPTSWETVVAAAAGAEEGAGAGVAEAPEAATTAGAAAGAFPALNASTSSAVTRPAGPEPGTLERSTPSCEASFLA